MHEGSVFSAGGSVPAAPRDSAETWASMVNAKQKAALSTRLGIPIIYGTDANHGHCYAYRATIFPHNVGLGATRYCVVTFHTLPKVGTWQKFVFMHAWPVFFQGPCASEKGRRSNSS